MMMVMMTTTATMKTFWLQSWWCRARVWATTRAGMAARASTWRYRDQPTPPSATVPTTSTASTASCPQVTPFPSCFTYTLQCNATHRNAMQCNAIRSDAMQRSAMQYAAKQCDTIQDKCTEIECNTMQYNAMHCNTLKCNTMQWNRMQHNAMQFSAKHLTRPASAI